MPFMRVHKCAYFLQDGAPFHKSKVVKTVLDAMKEEFEVLDWPGNSPDLNPIENCWSHMKAKLKNMPEVASIPKLERAITEM